MSLFTKESLETLRERVDLVEVIGSHVNLKRSGANFVGLCPFHDEKSPSFMIARGDKHYHCYGCGAHGDAIQFLTQHVRLSFSDAVESLSSRFQVKMERIDAEEKSGPPKGELKRALDLASLFYQFHLLHTPAGQKALDYLEARGITRTFAERFELGWAPEAAGLLKRWLASKQVSPEVMLAAGLLNRGQHDFFSARIQFPIKDANGSVIGFSGRKIREETFGGKYINTPETPLFKKSKVLFGLDHSRKRIAKEARAIVVEGQLDCLRLIDIGLNLTVAGQGTAFGPGHAEELIHLGVSEVFLALDGDNAGQEAAVKIGELFQKRGVHVRVVEFPKGDDPDSFLKREGVDPLMTLLEASGPYLPFLVRFESRQIDIQTPAGKAALVKKLSEQIKGWDHQVMVNESLRQLASLLQVPEELLGIGEKVFRHPLLRRSGHVGSVEIDPDRILEAELLRWLSSHKHLDIARRNLTPADLYSPTCRDLFQAYLSGDFSVLSPEAQALFNQERKTAKDSHFIELLQKILDRNSLRRCEEIKMKIQSNRFSEEEVLELAKEFSFLKNNSPKVVP